MTDSVTKPKIMQYRVFLMLLANKDNVSLDVASLIIKRSAYFNHHKAGWVNAPKHASKIEKGRYGYTIKFGANYFLIERAIQRCVSVLNGVLNSFEKNYSIDPMPFVVELLKASVTGSVAGHNGFEYNGNYPVDNNKMIFGTQAIDVKEFVNFILENSRIEELYKNSK